MFAALRVLLLAAVVQLSRLSTLWRRHDDGEM